MTNRNHNHHHAPDGDDRASLLVVSSVQEDLVQLRRILDQSTWSLTSAGTCEEALPRLRDSHLAAVLCERDLPDGSWKDVISAIELLHHPAHLIVTARLADEHLWAEVLNLGGFDVISKPFHKPEVAWVMESARKHRHMRGPRPRSASA